MTSENRRTYRTTMKARRLTLPGSAAVIASAIVVAGPLGYGGFTERAFAQTPVAPMQQGPTGFADLVARVKPAVIAVRVRIDDDGNGDTAGMDRNNLPPSMRGTPFEKFFRQYGFGNLPAHRHEVITGVGSGFFISADGYAVTNNHVVDHANSVQVTTDDGTIYTAKVLGTDPKTDLALIKIDGKKDFSYVNLENKTPRIGDWVVAVGNPYGLGGTVTAGIVSAEGRDIGSGPYDNYIQIDAPINRGNSGGPTFDTDGNVIGVNTAIYSPSGGSIGIGFDVPAPTVKMVVAQLKDKGVVTRGWLGVQVQPVTPGIAESLGLKKAAGALVDEAQPDTPAAQAGIRSGDVITSVNGNSIKDFEVARTRDFGHGPRKLSETRYPSQGRGKVDHRHAGEDANDAEARPGRGARPRVGQGHPSPGLVSRPGKRCRRRRQQGPRGHIGRPGRSSSGARAAIG